MRVPTIHHSETSCDESKCMTESQHGLFATAETPWLTYTCWSPRSEGSPEGSPEETASDIQYPCADGYEGHPLPDINRTSDNLWFEENVTMYVWYTCCPKEYSGVVEQQCKDNHFSKQSCSDSSGYDCYTNGNREPFTCHDKVDFKYPRLTGHQVELYTQYLCCTTDDGSTRLKYFLVIPLAILSGIGFLACSILIGAILCSSMARKQGYNLYVVFIAIPDAVFNAFHFIRSLTFIAGIPIFSVKARAIVYGIVIMLYGVSNTWINALLVHNIQYLVKSANSARRVSPPAPYSVFLQAVTVYAFSIILGVLLGLVIIWHNMRTGPSFFHSKESFDTVVTPIFLLLFFLPSAYVFVVTSRLLWGKLLPRSGRTRVLALYLLRLVGVYFVTWILAFMTNVYYLYSGSVIFYTISYCLNHLGGTLSVFVALTKPDVEVAIMGLLLCRCNATVEELYSSRSNFFGFMNGRRSSPDDSSDNLVASNIEQKDHEEERKRAWEQEDDWERLSVDPSGSIGSHQG